MSEARESDNPLESLKTLIANRRDETSLHHILLLLSSKAGAEWLPESNAADPFNRALKEDLQNAEKESRYDLSAANLRAYFHYVAASEEAPASVSSQT